MELVRTVVSGPELAAEILKAELALSRSGWGLDRLHTPESSRPAVMSGRFISGTQSLWCARGSREWPLHPESLRSRGRCAGAGCNL